MTWHPESAEQQGVPWLLRAAWPLPGALLGATLGFNLYFSQPGLNHDTAAGVLFAAAWALAGLIAGSLGCGLLARLLHGGLHRVAGLNATVAAVVVLLCLMGVCRLAYAPLATGLPSLLWPPVHPSPAQPAPAQSACAQAPPADPAVRKLWEQECR